MVYTQAKPCNTTEAIQACLSVGLLTITAASRANV